MSNNKVVILDENFQPFSISNPLPVTGSSSGGSSGLINFSYDTVEVTYPSATTEVYTFKLSGSTEGVVTIVYSDSSKVNLLSVTRS